MLSNAEGCHPNPRPSSTYSRREYLAGNTWILFFIAGVWERHSPNRGQNSLHYSDWFCVNYSYFTPQFPYHPFLHSPSIGAKSIANEGEERSAVWFRYIWIVMCYFMSSFKLRPSKPETPCLSCLFYYRRSPGVHVFYKYVKYVSRSFYI